MKAKDLKPGQQFTVEPPDSVGPGMRVCLTNDSVNGVRWGFPGKPRYWCWMGELCPVQLVNAAVFGPDVQVKNGWLSNLCPVVLTTKDGPITHSAAGPDAVVQTEAGQMLLDFKTVRSKPGASK